MSERFGEGWNFDLNDPVVGRLEKPRFSGLTMVIDKGFGLTRTGDLLDTSSEYIDFIKFSFGTSLIYPEKILRGKIELIKKQGIDVYPGGTLFEVAVTQNRINEYLFKASQLGFTAIEISNGTIYFSAKLRRETIFKAKSLGFKVLTEVGKKDRHDSLTLEETQEQIRIDLSAGADYIIIEGRESGRAISIYQADGSIDLEKLEGILDVVQGSEEILIWESPLKMQQAFLINKLGANVNLGNIQTEEVLALEALRRGLRGDTFKKTLNSEFVEDNISNSKGSMVGA